MSSQFKIDGSTVKDPISFDYDELYSGGKDWMGIYIFSAFYTANAVFNTLTPSEYSAWSAADNGLPHTLTCPDPGDPSTFTAFAGVLIRNTNADISNGLYFYGAQFRIIRICPLNLPLFGA